MSFKSTRREAFFGLSAAPTALLMAGCSKTSEDPATTPKHPEPPIIEGLLVNRERSHEIMLANKLDAIVCSRPENIFYLTNYYPQLSKMGLQNLVFAILPLDPYSKPILVIGQFEYYLAGAETIPTSELDVHIFTFPADPSLFAEDTVLESQLSASAMPSIIPASHSFHGLNASETAKRLKTLDLSASPGVNSEITLIKAVKDLPFKFKRLAVDCEQLASPFLKADMEFSYSNGDQILRDIRLQKTPMEIEIMRFAAQANAESGLAAAKTARAGATLYDIRREFYKECTARGLKPSFMVVDGDVSEHSNTKIAEGRSFLIDCVSSSLGYHGDYGRTVCIGDPTREIKKATDAIANVWESLLPQLKAGLTYGNIQEMAAKIFKEKPSDAALNCNPHSVGIHHTDEPSLGYSDYYSKANLTLMEGMVLSIDLPMVETGLGGSAHLEDLVLITKDGAELLNDAGDRVIIV